MQWRLLGLQFVDNADADPGTDGVDVFTKQEHFVMDYSKSNGQEWSYKGYTVDKFRALLKQGMISSKRNLQKPLTKSLNL
jgi:hypothetical protein